MDQRDLDNRFIYHPPMAGQDVFYAAIRAKAKELAELVNDLCPEGREKSLALTKIEEGVFWANAAVARAEGKNEAQVH